jgi:hypothetical protein
MLGMHEIGNRVGTESTKRRSQVDEVDEVGTKSTKTKAEVGTKSTKHWLSDEQWEGL